jgi:hypothetical protein
MANTNLTTIVDSYGCMSNYKEMKAFFSNPTNARGIQDAINKYGIPPQNRLSYRDGGLFGKWHDPCDFQNIEKFYQYAKLSVQFPSLTNPQTDCSKVASAISALNAQLSNIDTKLLNAVNKIDSKNNLQFLTDAIKDKISDYQSFNVVNDCENLVKNQSYLATTGATSKTAIYIFGGAAVVIGLFYAIAVYNKNK